MVLTKSASSSIAGIPEKDVPGARAFNGSYFTAMRLRSVFHPDPNEGARSLDISRTNLAPGVGLYDLKILSDIVSLLSRRYPVPESGISGA